MPPSISGAEPHDIVVAICTYNNAVLLDRALGALERQVTSSDRRWAVLVVDNNSTDDTAGVVTRHRAACRLSRLDIVREPEQGLAHARRRAVAETRAPLIAFVDDDCALSPEWVEEAVAFFSDHPGAGALGGRVELAWEEPPEPWLRAFSSSFAAQDHGDKLMQFPKQGVIRLTGAGLVCRRAALESSGWLSGGLLVDRQGTNLSSGGDLEIVLKIRQAGFEAWYTPALKLEHFIPSRRMQAAYLCRLHRGFGRARVPLHFLERAERPTSIRVLRALAYALRQMLPAALSMISRSGTGRVQARIALHEAWGRVEGAWGLLRGHGV